MGGAGQLYLVISWMSALVFAAIIPVDAQDQSGFISIDCGATEDYTDAETGLYYQTDDGFIDGGMNVQISFSANASSEQLKDVRSFPEGAKNCYTLTPQQGKGSRYSVRTRFFYGNYDGKNQAPTFDLYIGVNKWQTINSDGEEDYDDWWEIIFVPPTNYISVCVVNTGTGIPFISALELRVVPNAIYDAGSSMALDVYRRYDVGHLTRNLMRYKGDIYDRLWRELLDDYMDCTGDCQNITSSSAINVLNSTNLYKPPPELLRTAGQAPNATNQLGFHMNVAEFISRTRPMYVYFHFAEIEKLNLGQKRELFISSGGKNLHESFTLDYLVPLTIGPISLPIVRGGIQFSVDSNKKSGLPPIVNGFEIFRVLELAEGTLTDSQDVDAIMELKATYNLTRNWRGDPCVNSSWDGVSCSISQIPRIISLNLNSSGLTGGVATSFYNLKALQYLDLSNNHLTGPIPEFLSRFSSLKFLNLAGNNLTGSVPKALMQRSVSGALILRLDNNTNLCYLDSCGRNSKEFPVVPVVSSVSVFILLVIALAIWCTFTIKGMQKLDAFGVKNQEFTHSQIVSMTESFKTVIGEGGFGKVYLGFLDNGRKVAVKLLSSESKQGVKEFSQEIKLLIRVHHGNVVSLIGYCSDRKTMALVYEYMPNGNLKHLLSGEDDAVLLSWKDRVQIAVHAAQGLDYLHNNCVPPIIHCDLKTSNILLDENKHAKLADFGLSKAFIHDDCTHVTTTTPAGTAGYIDPLCQQSSQFSRQSDMYSFGVILLELVTAKPALIGGFHGISLLQWVLPQYNNGDIPSIVDGRLQENFNSDGARNLIRIAISCLNEHAHERPEINEVLAALKQCLTKEKLQSGSTSSSKPKFNSVVSTVMSFEAEMSQPTAR